MGLDQLLAAMEEQARQYRTDVERVEDGLRMTMPLIDVTRRGPLEWLRVIPFADVSTVDVRVRETQRAFHVLASARTSALVPLLAALVASAVSVPLMTTVPLAGPFVGLAVGLAAWGYEWFQFSLRVQSVTNRAVALLAGGA
jgi:hypothetical protein